MAKQKKYRGVENPAAHQAHVERQRSGAAGTHAQGTARERSRADAKRAALKREDD